MAGLMLTYRGQNKITPDADPRTLVAIQAATNVRAVIHSIEIDPAGTDGATAPLEFDLILLGNQTGLTDQSSKIVKEFGQGGSETIQTKVWEQPTSGQAEPTASGEPLEGLAVHRQSARIWVPTNANRRLVVVGGTTVGLRARFTAVPVRIGTIKFEE